MVRALRCHVCHGPHLSWAYPHLLASRALARTSKLPIHHQLFIPKPYLQTLMTLKTTLTQSLFVKESLLPSRKPFVYAPVSTP